MAQLLALLITFAPWLCSGFVAPSDAFGESLLVGSPAGCCCCSGECSPDQRETDEPASHPPALLQSLFVSFERTRVPVRQIDTPAPSLKIDQTSVRLL
jgi:hypothetical protein